MNLAKFDPPVGWPRISSGIVYDDLKAALDWLTEAFGFEVRVLVQDGDGNIMHTELEFGGGVIMLAGANPQEPGRCSPSQQSGRHSQFLLVYVDDVDAHHDRAKAAGATIVEPPANRDYGDRVYSCLDFEGHPWTFAHRVDQQAWDDSIAQFAVEKS